MKASDWARSTLLLVLLVLDCVLGAALLRHANDLVGDGLLRPVPGPDPLQAVYDLLCVALVGLLTLGVFAWLPSRQLADKLRATDQDIGKAP